MDLNDFREYKFSNRFWNMAEVLRFGNYFHFIQLFSELKKKLYLGNFFMYKPVPQLETLYFLYPSSLLSTVADVEANRYSLTVSPVRIVNNNILI